MPPGLRPVDWLAWHQEYADPGSSLSRRRRVVQAHLRAALAAQAGPVRLISLCAGDGEDVLGVLQEGETPPVQALLVELDAELADRARRRAVGLDGVRVVTGDAGLGGHYRAFGPAHVVLAVGVFGNIGAADLERTVRALPALLHPDGLVIWSRGRGTGDEDASHRVRELLAAAGFAELAFTAPDDGRYRVGLHRLARPRTAHRLLPDRLFTFE